MAFTREDGDRIARVEQQVSDLKESLPLMIEHAAERGVSKAIEKQSEVLEAINQRVDDVEKEQIRMVSTVRGVRWVGAAIVTGMGLLAAMGKKIF